MKIKLSLLLTLSLVAASSGSAYEIDTHALITSHAFERSQLATEEQTKRLGIDRFGGKIIESMAFTFRTIAPCGNCEFARPHPPACETT